MKRLCFFLQKRLFFTDKTINVRYKNFLRIHIEPFPLLMDYSLQNNSIIQGESPQTASIDGGKSITDENLKFRQFTEVT